MPDQTDQTDQVSVLIVDDEPVVRDSLKAWFAQDGYQVEVAAEASEALEEAVGF